MAIPIINNWQHYYENPDEGLGSSYERVVLNNIISAIVKEHCVESIIESPSFGFTGLSGVNLVAAAKAGIQVSLEDDDAPRLELIRKTWDDLGLDLRSRLNPGYKSLDYPDKSFDMAFNFSALWFVTDLRSFLSELARLTSKVIFLSVPNRSGIGYKGQLKGYSPELYPQLKPAFIDPPSIIRILSDLGWKLAEAAYFDCPLWPDIGMSKEDFLAEKLGIRLCTDKSTERKKKPPVSIMDYYRGQKPDFAKEMMRYSFLERKAPVAFKRIWAHHYYMKFVGPQA